MINPLRKNTAPVRFTDIGAALRRSAELYPDRPAVISRAGRYARLTYAELSGLAGALGAGLRALGLGGRHVLIVGESSGEWALGFLAVVCGLGVAVPVDSASSAGELARLAKLSDAGAVLYSENCSAAAEALPGSVVKVCFSAFPEIIRKARKGDPAPAPAAVDPSALSCILFATGPDGAPLGVMHSHSTVCSDLYDAACTIRHSHSDVFLSPLPLHHAFSCLCGLLFPLSVGACAVLCDGLAGLDRECRAVRPTVICATPALAGSLYSSILSGIRRRSGMAEVITKDLVSLTYGNRRLKRHVFREIHDVLGGRVRLIVCCGSPAPDTVRGLRGLGFGVARAFGLTECVPLAAVNQGGNCNYGAAGMPSPSCLADIYDIRRDGTGEIRCKGPGIMLGYYGDPDATARVIRDGWFYTGVYGYKDKHGFLYAIGRRSGLIVTASGKNIFPEELEAQLVNSPFVSEAAVAAYFDEAAGDRDLVAILVPDRAALTAKYGRGFLPGQVEAELGAAVDAVNARSASYKRLCCFVVSDAPLARTPAGRIDRAGAAEGAFAEYRKKITSRQLRLAP
jgi:long-chain acyl-CoA synthetase